MFKQIILPILGVAAFIAIVGYVTQGPASINLSGLLGMKTSSSASPSPTSQKTVTIDGKTIQISLADTNDKRTKGLSGVSSLDANSGMLFTFDSKQTNPLFWMKDMLIPIDIIWISSGKIVKIDANVPAPASRTPDSALTKYSAGQPVDYVLEVNAGYSNQSGFKVGDAVTLPTL